jgi:hypothetical protein
MTFKKGERVLTEEGEMGEILFVDRDGLEAQVALKHTSAKLRMDSLRKFNEAQVGKRARRSRKAGA